MAPLDWTVQIRMTHHAGYQGTGNGKEKRKKKKAKWSLTLSDLLLADP